MERKDNRTDNVVSQVGSRRRGSKEARKEKVFVRQTNIVHHSFDPTRFLSFNWSCEKCPGGPSLSVSHARGSVGSRPPMVSDWKQDQNG